MKIHYHDPEDRAPLYMRYPTQGNPQPAYIQLSEDGEISADWDGVVGSGAPIDVWNRQTLRWRLPHSELTGEDVNWLLDKVADDLEEIHEGHTVEWDERTGNMKGSLTEEASRLDERLEFKIRDLVASLEPVHVIDADDLFAEISSEQIVDDLGITDATTDDELAKMAKVLREEAWSDARLVVGSDDILENILKPLREDLLEV